MSNGLKSKTPLLLAALLVLGLAGFFGFQWHKGNLLRQGIEKSLAMLPENVKMTVGNIDVPLIGSSVILSDVTVAMDSALGPSVQTVKQVRITGLNPAAFLPETGVIPLADSVEATGMQWSAPGVDMRVASQRMEDLRGDAGLISREFREQWPLLQSLAVITPKADPKESLAKMSGLIGLIRAMETLYIGRLYLEDQEFDLDLKVDHEHFALPENIDPFRLAMRWRMEALEIREYSLGSVGPMRGQNLHMEAEDKSTVFIAALGWDSMRLPSYADLFALMNKPEVLENPDLANAELMELFKRQPLAINNLRLSDMRGDTPNSDQNPQFVMRDGSFSYALQDPTQDFQLRYSGLAVEKARLNSGEREIPEEVFALLPATLVMDGALEFTLTRNSPQSMDVDCKLLHAKLKDIGEASLTLTLNDFYALEAAMGRFPGQGTLVRSRLSLTDIAASNILLAVEAAQRGPNSTPEALRQQLVGQALGTAQRLPEGPFRTLAENLAQFLRAPGGSFELTIQPPQPLPMKELQLGLLENPEKLGLSSHFTPGK